MAAAEPAVKTTGEGVEVAALSTLAKCELGGAPSAGDVAAAGVLELVVAVVVLPLVVVAVVAPAAAAAKAAVVGSSLAAPWPPFVSVDEGRVRAERRQRGQK